MNRDTLPPPSLPPGRTRNLMQPATVRRHFEAQQAPVDAIPTPFAKWNQHCRDDGGGVGLARGWYVVVAGATGQGKTLAALAIGANAIQHGTPVAYISLEMSVAQLSTRLYAIVTGTPVRQIERGQHFDPAVAAEVEAKIAEMEGSLGEFHTHDQPVFDLKRVQGLMAHYVEQGGRLFIVDYLQLVTSGDEHEMSREVSKISHAMRRFAKERNVVVVALSQLNRSTSANRLESPTIHGVIGSSSIENDADQVLVLDHSRYARGEHTAKTWLLLGKNRHGSTGSIPVEWDYRTLRAREALPDELQDWPERGR